MATTEGATDVPPDLLPADPTDEVLPMPAERERSPSTDVLAERIESIRASQHTHEMADTQRHAEVLRAIEALSEAGDERGKSVGALVEAADARAHQRERWLVGLIGVLVLGVLGLAGVQVRGAGFGVEGAVGGGSEHAP